jgi:hypothetical protein
VLEHLANTKLLLAWNQHPNAGYAPLLRNHHARHGAVR